MRRRPIRRYACAAWLAAAFAAWHPAGAQDAAGFPNKPIRLIVGFGAGGGNDIIARLIGQKLSEGLGQPVIIENRPGANGEIAVDYVKNSAADGYTLLVAANGAMSVSPAVNKKLGYAPMRDFVPIGLVASFPLVLIVSPASGLGALADLIAYTKANPDKANYAAPSIAFQIAVERLKLKTGAPLQYIPYKSSAESITAVLSNATLTSLIDLGPAAGQIKAGQVKALAISSTARVPEFPDIPTFAEAGVAGLSMSFWSGLFAPAATPPAIVAKLEGELVRIIRLPDIQDKLKGMGTVPEGRSSDETRAFVAAEIERVADAVKNANIKSE